MLATKRIPLVEAESTKSYLP